MLRLFVFGVLSVGLCSSYVIEFDVKKSSVQVLCFYFPLDILMHRFYQCLGEEVEKNHLAVGDYNVLGTDSDSKSDIDIRVCFNSIS